MQEEQKQQAIREILAAICQTSQPANEVIQAYTRQRRYIGSHDRRFITDIVWKYMRFQAHIDFLHYTLDDVINKEITDTDDMPDWIRLECPQWLLSHIPDAKHELKALQDTAPTIVRAVGDRAKIQSLLADGGIESTPTQRSPYGLILKKRYNLQASAAYKDGRIEVQDEGSQLAALACRIQPGDSVLDFCAGAGGKSLMFSQIMNGTGQITAHDISAVSLKKLEERAKRAHAHNIITTTQMPKGTFSVVVVDAPCSGTGVWRRQPDARWKLTEQTFEHLLAKQAQILQSVVPYVQHRLCYITCSITRDENEEQIRRFMKANPAFSLVEEQRLSPWRSQTDGFYIALLER